MSTHVLLFDAHAHPDHNNDRADLAGKLIADIKPDVFVNGGDMWDLPSLSNYDKGKARFHGRSYRRDLDAGLEFDDRLWAPIRKAKKKRPRAYFLEGNHEERLKRALDQSSELEGTIGFKDFELEKNYTDIIQYAGNTPGIVDIDGIAYGHYHVSGVMGRNIGGEHIGYSLLTKQFQSATCGHIHTYDHCVRTSANGRRLNGLSAPCFVDYQVDWAGEVNNLWSRGIIICSNVENGNYDLQYISIDSLRKMYN